MNYDCVIIGGGPAGLSAGIYAVRGGLKTVLLERMLPGGQTLNADIIENYPGFVDGIVGQQLAENMQKQAERLGLEIVYDEALKISKNKNFTIETAYNGSLHTKTIILAQGAFSRKLEVPGEEAFIGRGVSYCAVCDGALFKGKVCTVFGGGDTAVGDAIYLSRFASKVYLVHRRDQFRAAKTLADKAISIKNIEIIYNAVPKEIVGTSMVEKVILSDTKTNATKEIACQGVFIAVGYIPSTKQLQGFVALDDYGYILVDKHMHTSQAGVFAAGDACEKVLRQVVTAAADGAIAADSAINFINGF